MQRERVINLCNQASVFNHFGITRQQNMLFNIIYIIRNRVLDWCGQFLAKMVKRTKIVVVGGGPAGISVISGLRQWVSCDKMQITLLEPSDFHFYQSAWINLALASNKDISSRRHIGELLSPDDINWINEAAGEILSGEQLRSNGNWPKD